MTLDIIQERTISNSSGLKRDNIRAIGELFQIALANEGERLSLVFAN